MTDTGTPQPQPATPQPQQQGPSLRVLAQYIKDLSFENPGVQAQSEQMTTDLGIDVKAAPHAQGNGIFEVSIKLTANAKAGDAALFITELDYAGAFQLQNVPEQDIEPMLLIECPRILFPFARRIIADITYDGGFPPLRVDPIDFVALYQQQKSAAAGAQAPVPPPVQG